MELVVRDKTFNINFVNNYVREQYQKILELSDEISYLPVEIDEIGEKELSKKEFNKRIREVEHKRTCIIKSISETRDSILKELLETNGCEYDEKWWKHKTDVNDINDFVLSCITKDVSDGTAKKK